MVEKMKVKALIPLEDFQRIYHGLGDSRECARKGCRYSRTTCHVRECLKAIRDWWHLVNGPNAPGFSHYERIFTNAIKVENSFYWHFWTDDMKPCESCHEELARQVRASFAGKPIDYKRVNG